MSHATFLPSSAHRWINCPGSIKLEKDIPDKRSYAAQQGTNAHQFASLCLESGIPPEDYIGKKFSYEQDGKKCTYTITKEFANNILSYIETVQDYKQHNELLIEQKVNFSHYLEQESAYGTADAIILGRNKLTIIDLKYGKGLKVYANNNEQMMLYALGAYYEYGFLFDLDEISLVIVQPRLNHVSHWSCSLDKLMEFAHKAKIAALKTQEDTPTYQVGEKQCRFCRAKKICPEYV